MAYTRIRYRVSRDQCEPLSHALERQQALSISIEDAGNEPHFHAASVTDPEWQQVIVTGLFSDAVDPAAVHRQLSEGDTPLVDSACAPQVEVLAEQDWQRVFMAGVEPIQIAEGLLWICPSWMPPPDPGATNIILDPGMAFGTGNHATTALCLQWLANADLNGKSVLDYGCGSGILALTAANLGAKRVIALDIDPHALRATRNNAAQNGLPENRLQIMTSPKELAAGTQVDVLVANILAETLVGLAPDLSRLCAANGTILLSGILETQQVQVQQAFAPDFSFICEQREQWCLLVGKRAAVWEHNA